MTIHAIFENGVFRPTQAVQLPEGTKVQVVVSESAEKPTAGLDESEPTPAQLEARRRIYELLSRSYDTGEPGNILETHNDHQP